MKIRCLSCGAALTKVKGKYICSNYHKGLRNRCPDRFTITKEEIEDIIDNHNIDIEDVKEFKINHDYHYQIVMRDGTIKGYDGSTLIV